VQKRKITTEDILAVKLVSDAQVSADGRSVAFVVADNHKEGPGAVVKSSIWLAELDEDGRPKDPSRQFTFGGRNDVSPRWSPSGDKLAFLSNREGGERYQLYTIDAKGGEAVRLTDLKGKIGPAAFGLLPNPIVWSQDGREIAFLMQDPPTAAEEDLVKKSGNVVPFEKNHQFCRIWTVNVHSGAVSVRTEGPQQIWEFDWSKDGKKFAVVVSEEPYEWSWYRSKLAVVTAKTGKMGVVYDPKPRQIARPLWSPDGSSIYFVSSVWSDRGIIAGDLFVVLSAGRSKKATDLTPGYKGSVSWMDWLSSGELLVFSGENSRAVLSTLAVDGRPPSKMKKIWEDDVAFIPGYWQRFSLSPSTGTIAVGREGLTSPPEAWTARLGSDSAKLEWSKLSEVNAGLQDLELADIQPVEWSSSDGLKIRGFLALPAGYRDRPKRTKLPMVVLTHGGPTLAFRSTYYLHNYSQPVHFLASKGFAVLTPNIRGSTGRGLRFAEANVGDMGGGDFQDMMAGVDHCLDTNMIDRKRLYITGHSYGGYMTAWAVTQTRRFRAAVVSSGISDWLSFHGTTEVPLWDSGHYRSDPYSPGNLQSRFSPIQHVKKVRTPTLIVVGAEDSSCPPTQSYQFFRALKELGVETELEVFPREGHGFSERAHILHVTNRLLDWITAH
jgi:dipeptidyl aminopeptidase/acylaminoacyl peptidase